LLYFSFFFLFSFFFVREYTNTILRYIYETCSWVLFYCYFSYFSITTTKRIYLRHRRQ
jgi:hypothetical protein